MAYIQCVSSFFSSRKDVFGNLPSNSKSFPCLSCARPDRGTRPDEPREAYLAALQSSSANLNPHPPDASASRREFESLLLLLSPCRSSNSESYVHPAQSQDTTHPPLSF